MDRMRDFKYSDNMEKKNDGFFGYRGTEFGGVSKKWRFKGKRLSGERQSQMVLSNLQKEILATEGEVRRLGSREVWPSEGKATWVAVLLEVNPTKEKSRKKSESQGSKLPASEEGNLPPVNLLYHFLWKRGNQAEG